MWNIRLRVTFETIESGQVDILPGQSIQTKNISACPRGAFRWSNFFLEIDSISDRQ